jgi:hypothetical protein
VGIMQITCGQCSRVVEYSGDRPSFCAYCGQALDKNKTTPQPLQADDAVTQVGPPTSGQGAPIPVQVAGYRLLKELGSGGMGAVYDAEEIASGRRVALKLISPEFVRSPDAVERFRQEGRIASMVAHPRCVFVLAVDEEAGRPYIVMERMPGATLKDLVDREGPLPADRAGALILDVIEGLQEAHRMDVIHRDVKPSNCFLEADGRVKVGDFGLAKSLVKDAHLTRTGAFVGTPHFASPEQVRGEPIDGRTDVYSTAATLYYLLTGNPPYQGSDSGAALARILTDPPPRLRQARPDLSPAFERVILRGLERDRERRWPDLESFRRALVTLTPPPLQAGDQSVRLLAYMIDHILLRLAGAAALLLLSELVGQTIFAVLFLMYFTLLEGLTGSSLGKRWLRLRVGALTSADSPPMPRVLVRTLLFFVLVNGGFLVLPLLRQLTGVEMRGSAALAYLFPWGWLLIGSLLAASTMRRSNGYRGVHELASGTRVFRLPEEEGRRLNPASGGWLVSFLLNRRLERGAGQAAGLPERIAGFAIRGALKWTDQDKVLLGEDPSLGRRVFIWLRPSTAPPLSAARRDVGRRTRLRWLACGKQGDLQWDALLAPSGCPLPDLVQSEGSFAWPQARSLLLELAGELAAACADGTLPPTLIPDQVWIHADGRVQLADLPLRTDSAESEGIAADQLRALSLLRQTAGLVLECRLRGPRDMRPIQALPEAPPPFLKRLTDQQQGFQTVQEVAADLKSVPDR